MGLFDAFKKNNINQGVAAFQQDTNAVLVDVRTPEEYAEGHIPESINIPVQKIEDAYSLIPDQNQPLYVYCQSGARSSRAAAALQEMGYTQIHNIGGINSYTGEIVK